MKTSFLFLILVFICSIGYASTNDLPQIKDAAALLKDCQQLYQQFPSGEIHTNNTHLDLDYKQRYPVAIQIPKDKWTESILNLHPIGVTRDFFGICIMTATRVDTRTPSWKPGETYHLWLSVGYFVQCNQISLAPHSSVGGFARYEMKPTPFNDIEEFYEPSLVK